MRKLSYTGHPFVDVGIAAITAFAQKMYPEDVSSEDLKRVANYIEMNYTIPPLTSVLTMSLPNSGFTQPAFDREKKREYARIILDGLSDTVQHSEEFCAYTGEPALGIPLALKDALLPGRAFRQHVPLLTGEGTINFFPDGDAGLPISGMALLALQFFPMGCAKCGVGLLAIHADNPQLTFAITRRFFNQNMQALGLAQAANETKLQGSHRSPKTLLIETLVEADQERYDKQPESEVPASVTAYNFTNSGQGVELVLYHLPLQIVNFLRIVRKQTYVEVWKEVVDHAWQTAKPARGNKAEGSEPPFEPRHNYLYEDLFGLERSQSWGRFVRTYFLRIPQLTKIADDPRRSYSFRDELRLVSWPLVELFLRKVVNMEADRVDQIRVLGDKLAAHVVQEGNKRFFQAFFTAKRSDDLRLLLLKANLAAIRAGEPSLYDMETYISVFQEGEDVMRPDWRLARDLVLMRMIDQLKDKWGPQLREAVAENDLQIESDEANG